jgi:hypothetical protein
MIACDASGDPDGAVITVQKQQFYTVSAERGTTGLDDCSDKHGHGFMRYQQQKPERSYRKRAEPGAEACEASPGDIVKNLCDAENTGIAQQLPERGAGDVEPMAQPLKPAPGAQAIMRSGVPEVGSVRFGDLRNVSPISQAYGLDRGDGLLTGII